MATQFKYGDRVMDRDGYQGIVQRVTEWKGSTWYDVRVIDGCRIVGEAVRYDSDLRLV